jgi:hypothetical protein
MSDAANASIPPEIRTQFPCDDAGRMLWFTNPPLNHEGAVEVNLVGRDGRVLAHTPEYLAKREERRKLIEARKAQRMEAMNGEDGQGGKRRKVDEMKEVEAQVLRQMTNQVLNSSGNAWAGEIYGDCSKEFEAYDALRAVERQKEAEDKKAYFEERRRAEEERRDRERKMEGRVFRDDWDARY